ncbi:hypothetical protein LNP74_14820 [Klebsiella pneumoniae subsp. pneumoniae]|nr:hypothetical protein [Klebsiella pneumoniae subsp. pneumoniae]
MKYTSHFPLGIVIPLLACSVPLRAAENYDRTIDALTRAPPLPKIARRRWS